jgi:hypothetical protein
MLCSTGKRHAEAGQGGSGRMIPDLRLLVDQQQWDASQRPAVPP